MFTVYCQQSFCTWKAKLLIFLPWSPCQLARLDWRFPFSQSQHLTAGKGLGGTHLSAPTGVLPPSLREWDLLECQSRVINNDI